MLSTTCVEKIKGVGPKRALVLKKMGLNSIEDLFYHFPVRYEDRSRLKKISDIKLGESQSIKAEVVKISIKRLKRGMSIAEATVKDDTGFLRVIWFNQHYLVGGLKPGVKLFLYGKLELYKNRIQMNSPAYEILEDDEDTNYALVVPIYRLSGIISQKVMRSIIKNAFECHGKSIEDFLPANILSQCKLMPIIKALNAIHFPDDLKIVENAKERFVFDDFFLLQIAMAVMKNERQKIKAADYKFDNEFVELYKNSFPFKLTAAQSGAIDVIAKDMSSRSQMKRLLHGDVGSGKTVVAGFAMALSVRNGYQAALMVPTEILARQHFFTISSIMLKFAIRVGLLTSSMSEDSKSEMLNRIACGDVDIIVGTHSLLQKNVKFKNLKTVVIDEQHRFGVDQCLDIEKKAKAVDILLMSATPIPRSLALTVFGDIDVTQIDELPRGRKNVKTFYIQEYRRSGLYKFISSRIDQKEQVYVVCPLIENIPGKELSAVEKMYSYLKDEVFANYKVGLIHGKLKRDIRDKIMLDFKNGDIDVIVATTIIEVGIDIPSSTIMVIENVERFGLGQLHQLRGRVGRSDKESYCFLLGDLSSDNSKKRVAAILDSSDGFEIAEEDLALRGPGEFFGTRQWGLAELRVADIVRDFKVLEFAKQLADECVKGYISMNSDEKKILWLEVKKRFQITKFQTQTRYAGKFQGQTNKEHECVL